MDYLDQALEAAGGATKLALLLGVRQSTVSNWKSRGTQVPPEYCADIERATQYIVRRWDLRPSDWHRIWPELIGAEGAPEVPDAAPVSQPGALDEAPA